MKLQTGDILLLKGDKWTSRIVSWFTNSPYTHVAIAYDSDKILEIDISKRLSFYNIDPNYKYEVFRYKDGLSLEMKNRLKATMIGRKSTMRGYDWLKIISLGFSKLFKKPFFMDMKNHVICSEIVDMLYSELGIDLVPGATLGHVTPDDIRKSSNIKYVTTLND